MTPEGRKKLHEEINEALKNCPQGITSCWGMMGSSLPCETIPCPERRMWRAWGREAV
jgi:hypothetical protein